MSIAIAKQTRVNMAKDSSELLGVIGVLREALKISCKNKQLMFFITLFTLFFHSLLALANIYSHEPLFIDLFINIYLLFNTDQTSSVYHPKLLLIKIKKQVLVLIGFELALLVLTATVSVFSMVATIHVSAIPYVGKSLNLKELCSSIKRIWKRPVVSLFYMSVLTAGFSLMVLPIARVPVLLFHDSLAIRTFGALLLILASFLNIYLAMTWMLSLVISVLEDCDGLQVLGEAEKLIKGRKVHGFVLTLVLSLPASANFLVYMRNINQQIITTNFGVMFVTINMVGLLKIISMMMYTVFYFECKKIHGLQVQDEENLVLAVVGYQQNPLLIQLLPK